MSGSCDESVTWSWWRVFTEQTTSEIWAVHLICPSLAVIFFFRGPREPDKKITLLGHKMPKYCTTWVCTPTFFMVSFFRHFRLGHSLGTLQNHALPTTTLLHNYLTRALPHARRETDVQGRARWRWAMPSSMPSSARLETGRERRAAASQSECLWLFAFVQNWKKNCDSAPHVSWPFL